MSGAPKRSHEESGHSSSKYTHEDHAPFPRLMSAVSSEYHLSHDMGQESRMAKIPRTESRDSDRRSPMHSVFRMPSSSVDDSHLDHPVSSESRLEARDAKDGRDFRVDNRDPKPEMRDSYEMKRDSQHMRSEREGKVEMRSDDAKKLKYERDSYSDPKVDGKVEKENYSAGSSHLNWKESKEYHRGKRYSEAPSGSVDPWHIQRNNPPGQFESAKEDPTTEERGHMETHEAVGENKIDIKIDDKMKDKDRKRKDAKHRESVEREKDRIDRRSGVPVNNSAADLKDPARDEREAEKLEKDRKDPVKDKERLKEREKDHPKRENWGVSSEKDATDLPAKTMEQETSVSDLKKHKDFDVWKNVDKDARERKKERDTNMEVDRTEKRGRGYEKESEDGCADAEGMEREREVFNYDGVQQRKRMLRPRGSPQLSKGDPRFRSRTQDNDG